MNFPTKLHPLGFPESFTELAKRINLNGGVTYNAVDDTFPTSGFAVSVFKGEERILDFPTVTETVLFEYFQIHSKSLQTPGACFGAWRDDGRMFLDISIVVSDLNTAITLAKEHKQLAVFDLYNKVSFKVE